MARRRSRSSTRRRTSRGRGAGGFIDREALKTGATAALAVVGINKILPRIIPASMASNPYAIPIASIVVGLAAGALLRRTSPALARGAAIGGVVGGGVALIQQVMPTSGMGAMMPREFAPALGAGYAPREFSPALGAAPDSPPLYA